MSGKDHPTTSAVVYPLAARDTREAAAIGAHLASTAAEARQTFPERTIERVLQIKAAGPLDRIGVEALESLLGEVDTADQLTLRLSLTEPEAVRLGLALPARTSQDKAAREQSLAAALDFAIGLITAGKRP